ncbi:MAG: mandelate racemase/muconate lactonizing enzyme family protein, partial [Proteobacteria bacterium]|nr:mandelate racemase/muconate lactonizing enzyme family protein [Pseudomonadota bacterium]
DFNRAKTFAAACYDNRILWLEEPLDSRDYNGNARLKDAARINIAGAELNYGWDELKIMFEKDCFDIYQPDATFAGGIAQVLKVIEMCHNKKRLFSPHTWTNGIGFYINWNMALADNYNSLPLEYPLEMPSWIPEFREGIIAPILPDNNGMLVPFERPGLGFEIDKRLLRKYGKRFYKLTRSKFVIQVIREKGFKEALKLKRRKKHYA